MNTASDEATTGDRGNTTTNSDTEPCLAEEEACMADSACASCVQSLFDAQEACDPDFNDDTATCSESIERGCLLRL